MKKKDLTTVVNRANMDQWWAEAREWFGGQDASEHLAMQQLLASNPRLALRNLSRCSLHSSVVCRLANLALQELAMRHMEDCENGDDNPE